MCTSSTNEDVHLSPETAAQITARLDRPAVRRQRPPPTRRMIVPIIADPVDTPAVRPIRRELGLARLSTIALNITGGRCRRRRPAGHCHHPGQAHDRCQQDRPLRPSEPFCGCPAGLPGPTGFRSGPPPGWVEPPIPAEPPIGAGVGTPKLRTARRGSAGHTATPNRRNQKTMTTLLQGMINRRRGLSPASCVLGHRVIGSGLGLHA